MIDINIEIECKNTWSNINSPMFLSLIIDQLLISKKRKLYQPAEVLANEPITFHHFFGVMILFHCFWFYPHKDTLKRNLKW